MLFFLPLLQELRHSPSHTIRSVELSKHFDSHVNNGDMSLEPRGNGEVPRSESCTCCAYVTFLSKCNSYFLLLCFIYFL